MGELVVHGHCPPADAEGATLRDALAGIAMELADGRRRDYVRGAHRTLLQGGEQLDIVHLVYAVHAIHDCVRYGAASNEFMQGSALRLPGASLSVEMLRGLAHLCVVLYALRRIGACEDVRSQERHRWRADTTQALLAVLGMAPTSATGGDTLPLKTEAVHAALQDATVVKSDALRMARVLLVLLCAEQAAVDVATEEGDKLAHARALAMFTAVARVYLASAAADRAAADAEGEAAARPPPPRKAKYVPPAKRGLARRALGALVVRLTDAEPASDSEESAAADAADEERLREVLRAGDEAERVLALYGDCGCAVCSDMEHYSWALRVCDRSPLQLPAMLTQLRARPADDVYSALAGVCAHWRTALTVLAPLATLHFIYTKLPRRVVSSAALLDQGAYRRSSGALTTAVAALPLLQRVHGTAAAARLFVATLGYAVLHARPLCGGDLEIDALFRGMSSAVQDVQAAGGARELAAAVAAALRAMRAMCVRWCYDAGTDTKTAVLSGVALERAMLSLPAAPPRAAVNWPRMCSAVIDAVTTQVLADLVRARKELRARPARARGRARADSGSSGSGSERGWRRWR